MDRVFDLLVLAAGDGDADPELPPGSPPTCECLPCHGCHRVLTPPSQIRGPLVHHTDITCIIYRIRLVYTVFVLSSPMAAPLCATHKAQRYSRDTRSEHSSHHSDRVFAS